MDFKILKSYQAPVARLPLILRAALLWDFFYRRFRALLVIPGASSHLLEKVEGVTIAGN